jgi:hypothetical protein
VSKAVDLAGLARYRRGSCLPECNCADLELVRIDRQEWQRARTRYRLHCQHCGRWGQKFVPERFLKEAE